MSYRSNVANNPALRSHKTVLDPISGAIKGHNYPRGLATVDPEADGVAISRENPLLARSSPRSNMVSEIYGELCNWQREAIVSNSSIL